MEIFKRVELEILTSEDQRSRYGDDESSESDNEGDLRDEIALVPRN